MVNIPNDKKRCFDCINVKESLKSSPCKNCHSKDNKPDFKPKWSCYDCMWSSDKCKNRESDQYNKFLRDIEKCNFTGDVDNSLGCSWRTLGQDI